MPTNEPQNASDFVCSIDEVIRQLQSLRGKRGRVGVMVRLEGGGVPYLPVNGVELDDDDPKNPVVLMCVADGNHPLGNVIRMRPADFHWRVRDPLAKPR